MQEVDKLLDRHWPCVLSCAAWFQCLLVAVQEVDKLLDRWNIANARLQNVEKLYEAGGCDPQQRPRARVNAWCCCIGGALHLSTYKSSDEQWSIVLASLAGMSLHSAEKPYEAGGCDPQQRPRARVNAWCCCIGGALPLNADEYMMADNLAVASLTCMPGSCCNAHTELHDCTLAFLHVCGVLTFVSPEHHNNVVHLAIWRQ